MAALTKCILLLMTAVITEAYPKFKDQIPNGNNVPHSCDRTKIWNGVGHELPGGAGPFNAFGRDFNAAGQTWTKGLCQLDSDGDGIRNGAELGDPDCVWTPGRTPAITNTTLLSHPGVCEPLESAGCQVKNAFLASSDACSRFFNKTDWCPAISGPDVKKLVLRFNEITIPANDTSYLCQIFDLPSDYDYQIIAYEPFITNVEIMHHLVSFVCDNPDEVRQLNAMKPDHYKNPVLCGMSPVCRSFTMGWAFGQAPRCYDDHVGIPFGKSYFNKTILQLHYNNPEQRSNYVDSSGVVIYYTRKLRPQNLGSMLVGQMDIRLPPRTPWVHISGEGLGDECSKTSLSINKEGYNMTSVLFHMHKTGVYGKFQLKKASGKVITLLDGNVTYDRPPMLIWDGDDAIPLEIGDSIYVECGFNTTSRANWTFFGERTSDEMCVAYIETYPLVGKKFSFGSMSNGPYSSCSLRKPKVDNCSVAEFRNIANYTKVNKLGSFAASCSCSGIYPVPYCSSDCYSFLNKTGFLSLPACLNNTNLVKMLAGVWDSPVDIIASQVQKCALLSQPPPAGSTCTIPSKTSDSDGSFLNAKMRRLVQSVITVLQGFLES